MNITQLEEANEILQEANKLENQLDQLRKDGKKYNWLALGIKEPDRKTNINIRNPVLLGNIRLAIEEAIKKEIGNNYNILIHLGVDL